MFYVINSETGIGTDEAGYPAQSLIKYYETGEEAARIARNLTDNTGYRHQVRPKLELDWRAREQLRFGRGEYKAPAWVEGSGLSIAGDHFLHVAQKDPTKLAYIESEEKGARDIQTVIRVGAYLSRYHGSELSEARLQELIHAHMAAHSEAEHVIEYEQETDKIIALYREGHNMKELNSCGSEVYPLASCMSHRPDHYETSKHPLSVYGGLSDLCLAYVRDKKSGELIARAIVWLEDKKFYRTYGSNRLTIEGFRALLQSEGFTRQSLEGARIHRIYCEDAREYILPYLDGLQHVTASSGGQFFVICEEGEGELIACNQNGLGDEYDPEPEARCERCNDGCDEHYLRDVWVSRRHTQAWCMTCRSDEAFTCEGHGGIVAMSESVTIDGELYASWYAEENANYCEHTGEHTFDDVTQVRTLQKIWGGNAKTLELVIYSNTALARAIELGDAHFCRITGVPMTKELAQFDDWSPLPRLVTVDPNDKPEGFSGSYTVRSFDDQKDFTFIVHLAA